MTKLKVLDLFSGIGGFSLGLERTGGFETVAFCEIEEFPRQVLAKHWPDVPCHKDVRELTSDAVGPIDVICGGYPCQPFSTAGKRQGADDDRHLWPEVHRLMASIRPTWGIFENVAGHVSMGLDQVLSDLEGEGYTAWPLIIPACALDAPHRRDRVWVVAHSERDTIKQRCEPTMQRGRSNEAKQVGLGSGGNGEFMADTAQLQRNGSGKHTKQSERQISEFGNGCGAEPMANTGIGGQQGPWSCWHAGHPETESQGQATEPFNGCIGNIWGPEPAVGRVAHGVPRRVDRLKSLGNAVVPQIPEMIGRAILEAENVLVK
jgi:DNA (cytosine-5)-methyltransferase 1